MSFNRYLALVFILGLVIGLSVPLFIPQVKTICPICSYEPTDIEPDQIQPVTDQQYFNAINDLLKSANKSVHIVMFEVKYYEDYPNSSMNSIIKNLIDLRKNGVDVKIIADEYLTEKSTVNYLKSNNIDIKFESPDRTTHDKLIIIDGKIIVVGSTNWSYYAIEKNREANVVIYSEDVASQFENYFQEIWENL
jgi:phosphatidylserine/phosphatidylglycerophosphate/cardiolipin synthase-like enzyme